MTKKHTGLSLIFFVFLLYACGGVIGNIKKYRFPGVSQEGIKDALNRVYVAHPELQKKDPRYGVNDGDAFYFILDHEGERFVFECHVIFNSSYNNDLSLTTAATWGGLMNFSSDMGFFERRKYRKLFEDYILPEIEKEIKKSH
jgi:hypothetical protein